LLSLFKKILLPANASACTSAFHWKKNNFKNNNVWVGLVKLMTRIFGCFLFFVFLAEILCECV
jgi:hypothetical protein